MFGFLAVLIQICVLFTGPPLLNNNNNSSLTKSDNGKLKDFTQYEPLFNQVSDERRTINCFELQDLLETCLPNGKVILSYNIQAVFLHLLRQFEN